MLSVIAGILLVIIGVALWLGALSTVHALAIFIVVIGIILILTYVVPTSYYSRRRAG